MKTESEPLAACSKHHHWMGAFYGMLAALFTALIGLVVKLIGPRASTDTTLFVRYLISFICIIPWVFKDPKKILSVQKPLELFLRSGLTLLSVAGFFYALKYIPLTNAILLNNSYPLFVPLILRIFHKTKTSVSIWMGICLGLIGLVLVLKPDPHGFKLPSVYGLLSGITSAGAVIYIRLLTRWATITQILFYNFLIGLVVSGGLIPFFPATENWISLIPLFGCLGIFAVAYQVFSTLALSKAPAQIIAPIIFLSVVFGVPLDYFFWGQIPDLLTAIGMISVIAGGVLTIYSAKKVAKKPQQ